MAQEFYFKSKFNRSGGSVEEHKRRCSSISDDALVELAPLDIPDAVSPSSVCVCVF